MILRWTIETAWCGQAVSAGARRGLAAFIFLLLAVATPFAARAAEELPAAAAPPAFVVKPDHAGMADNFLSGLTGWSPAALGSYLDIRDRVEIGILIVAGDYAGAARAATEHLAAKAAASVPVLGQWYALGQLGASLGDWAVDHFGEARFDGAYRVLSERLSAEEWTLPFGDPRVDADLTAIENANLLTFIDKQTGGGRTPAQLQRMLWDMLKARRQFDTLCDHYGLAGAERTYDNMARRYDADVARMAAAAKLVEDDRIAREKKKLEEKWRADQAFLAKQAAEREAQQKLICDAWLGRVVVDPDKVPPRPAAVIVEELCGARPPADAAADDDDGNQSQTAVDSAAADATPDQGRTEEIGWTIVASASNDATRFRVFVTNMTGARLSGIAIAAVPSGPFASGGIIHGATAGGAGVTLPPGGSRGFDIIATGDVRAIAGTISVAGRTVAQFVRPCLHEPSGAADGRYAGGYSGAGNSGTITLVVEGGKVTGSLSGGYADARQTVSITATVSGTFDASTGALTAEWGGRAVGSIRDDDGEELDVDEAVGGQLSGRFRDGAFAGAWSGGSAYVEDEGEWSAAR